MSYFTKLPNKLFYSNIEGEESILKKVANDKVLMVLDYLYTNTNRKNIIKFTLENMIIECGFKPSTKSGENNEQFKNILIALKDLHLVSADFDFNKIKPRDFVSCTLNIDLENKFVILEDVEKDKILTQAIEKTDNLKLLIYYCYLKCRMYKRSKTDGDINMSGGRATVTWVSYETINHDLGIVDESIKKYNDILVKLNLIRIGSAGNWYYKDDKNKIVRESNNIYSLFLGDEEATKNNLKEGIKYYKSLEINSNKVFTSSKSYKNNNRKLNGELGSIIKKENKGTATQEDVKRKNEILASINADNEQFKIKALLSSNEGELLSVIYSDLNKEKVADKYYDLEINLGLIDEDGNLLVDYDYYSWVMVNYTEEAHQFYFNSIKKHKRSNRNKMQGYRLEDYYNDTNNSAELDFRIEQIHIRLESGENPEGFDKEDKFIYHNYINVSYNFEELI